MKTEKMIKKKSEIGNKVNIIRSQRTNTIYV